MTAPIRARARVGSRLTSMPKREARPRDGREGGEVTVLLAEAFEVDGGVARDWLFDDGFHRIAIYRDILKSLVKIQRRIGPRTFRARPVRRVAGALKPREKVSHLWSRSSRR